MSSSSVNEDLGDDNHQLIRMTGEACKDDEEMGTPPAVEEPADDSTEQSHDEDEEDYNNNDGESQRTSLYDWLWLPMLLIALLLLAAFIYGVVAGPSIDHENSVREW